jgi:hypothetical protein
MSVITTPEAFYQRACGAAAQVCRSEPGRILLEYLAARFFLGTQVHVPGDPCQTAHNDGSRIVILTILEMAGLTTTEDVIRCLKKEPQEL